MFLIYWVVYGYLLILTRCQKIPDVTIISQYLNYNSKFNMTCVISGKTMDSAIAWNEPLAMWYREKGVYGVSDYIPPRNNPYNCKINAERDSCNSYWVGKGTWTLHRSVHTTIRAVTDQRWEGFTQHYTDGTTTDIQLILLDRDKFKINLSIRTNQAHVYFCSSNSISSSNCYLIILGKISSIKKCPPQRVCGADETQYISEKPLVNNLEWNHFAIERNSGRITVWKNTQNNPVLSYNDPRYFRARYLLVHSYGSPGYWKLHSYSFTATETASQVMLGQDMIITDLKFCMAMFVVMCGRCTLRFEVFYRTTYDGRHKTLADVEIEPKQAMAWQELKIEKTLPSTPAYVQLRVTSRCPKNNCAYPYWAIDNVEFCSENELRALTITQEADKASCQIIKYDSQQIYQTKVEAGTVQETNCPVGSFGRNCIKCSRVLGVYKPNCDQSVICSLESNQSNICKCAAGYQPPFCTEECPRGRYGTDCSEECGNCQYPPCNPITGECPAEECLHPFMGPQCKTPSLPVLLNPPEIVEVGYTSITVRISNSSYDGRAEPAYYKIQYEMDMGQKELSSSAKETNIQVFNDFTPIKIEGLNILTGYIVQAALITEKGESYNGTRVPKTQVTTTCKVIEESDIDYKEDNTSITINIKNNEDNCKIGSYDFMRNNNVLTVDDFRFIMNQLEPFTDYQLVIRNKLFDKTVTINLKTKEGAPSEIEDVKITDRSTTSFAVNWQPPLKKNGNIQHYRIKYKHAKYLGCENDEKMKEDAEKTIYEKSTSTVIRDLLPYSEYMLEIIAVTIMDGKPVEFRESTSETENPDISELPAITNTESQSVYARITFEISDCTRIKGPAIYYLSWQCSNEWCSHQPLTTNVTSIKSPVLISNLLPYSNYTVKAEVGRLNGNLLENENVIETFQTKTSVPNTITNLTGYSKTGNSISFRLSPPYPPTGEIAEYSVEYCYHYQWVGLWYEDCQDQTFKPTNCILWPTFHCFLLDKLVEDQNYNIKVKAKNEGTTFNQPVSSRIRTVQEAPDNLRNLTYKWDDDYNLTLTWHHPSKTNGPLTKFIVRISSKDSICSDLSFPINESSYNVVYNYTIPLEKCYSSELRIAASAFNIKEGAPEQLNGVISPPSCPSFSKEPSVKAATNTTIELSLPSINDFEQSSVMYVIVSSTSPQPQSVIGIDVIPDIKNKLNLPDNSFSWIAAEFDNTNVKNEFIVGDDTIIRSNKLKRELRNAVLDSNMMYTMDIAFVNEFGGFKRYRMYKAEAMTLQNIAKQDKREKDKKTESPANNALFALFLLLLVPFIIYLVFKKKEIKSKLNLMRIPVVTPTTNLGQNRSPDVIPLTTNTDNTPSSSTQVLLKPKRKLPASTENPAVEQVKVNKRNSTTNPNEIKTNNKFSKPVKIIDFERYIKDSIENGELERQHQLFPRGQTKPWDYGLLPQNKSKNRYNNLVAYDHTRIKLAKINNDPYSDYINANYIEGYNGTKKAYIATQGPKVATVNDFWRMIWQENVNYIVMLANVIEGGKKKSEQYWPNVNEFLEFGDIKVEYYSSRVFADYEYRTFAVTNKDVKRTVEQLHFTSWPDHGVPLYSQSLVPFLRKLLTIPQGTSPIVVHCSAGVGRTGTIVLCDICLRMAAREGVVDVLKHQHNLREQRANLVDNIEQYKLAHLVLLECLVAMRTSITCDEKVESTILQLLKSDKLQQQMQYINDAAWQDQAMRPVMEVVAKPEWSVKNRFQDIIPLGYGKVYLSRFPVNDEHSDYINAVEVDGFRCPQQFIVTQQPLKTTVSEFWRMIDEKEVTTIVSLNKINLADETSCIFWPTAKTNEINPVPYLKIQFHNKTDNNYYNIVTVHMYNTKEKKSNKRIVNVITLKEWDANKSVPNSEESLLMLWEETERLGRGDSPIVVTCYDGAKACGLFIALSFVIEKIKLEQECDVCLAVRTVRRNRKQFVTEMEQFLFLYRAAICYLRSFDLYSNFTTGKQ